jgi:nucleoside-diphosphate-sugar epimerase
VVVHTAVRVHVMSNDASNPLSEFRKVNSDATLVLAHLAAESGVKRFVFVSSIKVNGEMTRLGHLLTPDDVHVPDDPYGLSKYEAERGLLALAQETGMEVVIIPPPLVYGPGVKANFSSMMQWMGKPVLLLFGAIHNRRSLVVLDNLVSFISLCADRKKSPQAANQVFLISDSEDVSTTQLLRKVGQALNLQSPSSMKAWIVPVPVSTMTFFAKLLGKGDMANRLFVLCR